MTTLEHLRAARELISNREDWGGGPGEMVSREGPRRCAALAIGPYREPINALAREIGWVWSCEDWAGFSAIWDFNDSHTHAEVLAAFDRAIANEEACEAEFRSDPVQECVEVNA